MSKVFLSHSSKDKFFVEPIAELLGRNNCVYDKYTFEIGMKTIDEIFSSLETTDVFVYFISHYSLESNWVKKELNKAKELLTSNSGKLVQIFPIIIDDSIRHDDERIAPFLRNQYNLQRVDNYILAYRKIIQQLSKINYENELLKAKVLDTYYGRDKEIIEFKEKIDGEQIIKSAVISGIPGIGKKSFIHHALIHTKLIKPYYKPIVLSMPKNGGIEDLIVSISDAGFGEYNLSHVSSITNMDDKIALLTEVINNIINFNEVLIVEDDETIVSLNGELKYWYYKALQNSINGIGIIITSSVNAGNINIRNYPDIFFKNLKELDYSDRLGLLRTYSESIGLELTASDRFYFKDCLTGYPPQILFCANLIKDNGIDYAKDNSNEIADMPEQISSMILDKCMNVCKKEYVEGILAVIAKMEIVPIKLLNQICKTNQLYRDAINVLKKYSVCYVIGANGEYIKMNSFIENFVTRNRMPIPENIQHLLEIQLESFNNNIDNIDELAKWDTTELKFCIKNNLKKGIGIGTFLYSTMILQTVAELYNEKAYSKVIEIINETKENERFIHFDHSVVVSLQRYLCQALVKDHDMGFEAEVEYFREEKLWNEYYFLKGFWNRCLGRYSQAEENLNKVLEFNRNHLASKRELVIVYLSIQDFESALELAKSNYYRRRDNIFNLQAYLECLFELKELTNEQVSEIQEMICSVKRIHRVSPTPLYYQLLGKYAAFYENNKDVGISIIDQGLEHFCNNMYLVRDKFDIFRKSCDLEGMIKTLDELKSSVSTYQYKGVYYTRKAILDLFMGVSQTAVKIGLREQGFNEKVINNILKKGPNYKK